MKDAANTTPETHPLTFLIGKQGDVTVAYHPDLQSDAAADLTADLGVTTADARGGHVYPARRAKRWAFKALRRLCGSGGRVAAWTRTWRGPWIVERADTGERLPGAHPTHAAAVEAEVAWMLKTK